MPPFEWQYAVTNIHALAIESSNTYKAQHTAHHMFTAMHWHDVRSITSKGTPTTGAGVRREGGVGLSGTAKNGMSDDGWDGDSTVSRQIDA
jgi:hypothetical protein